PAVAYLAKNAGLDLFMFHCEHSSFTLETLHETFLTANALGVTGMLRVPGLSREHISRALDAGAGGVMVPMLETAEQAELLVRYAKYQPLGGRGFTAGAAHTDYAGGRHREVMDRQNARVMAIAQIETELAVDNAAAIAAVPGIDALLIGPNDLSVSLGIPGEVTHPRELEAIDTVAAACRKHGKFFSLHAGPALADRFRDRMDFIMQGLDSDFLVAGFAAVRHYADAANTAHRR
ncbi:MAG: hypothetical protein LIP77_01580, partial [Planctomycetes bacterium]|nr:hypothetical protein [Planctomycetota bacterium]